MPALFEMLKDRWVQVIQKGLDAKKPFADVADECMRFFNGPYTFLYDIKQASGRGDFQYMGSEDRPKPTFTMTVNKMAEAVQLFGPVLYHKNPNREVKPRQFPVLPIELFGDPNDPKTQAYYMPIAQQSQQAVGVDKARAILLNDYLNYTPTALDLKTESRYAIDEAIIKGMGCLWTESYTPKGGQTKMVGSFYDSVDNLVADPDMQSFSLAKWIARRYVRPVWEVEQEFGLPPGTLKGNMESRTSQAIQDASSNGADAKNRGETNDLVEYWKVYSKMGMGSLLKGRDYQELNGDLTEFDRFGQYVYLAITPGIEYPLNLPPEIVGNDQEIMKRVQWDTPFWADDGWPFSPLIFHNVPNSLWPMSHFTPGLGELKFINWAYSFVASKIATTARDLLAVAKSAGEEIKRALISGKDLEMIEIESTHGKSINEIVQFLQHPSMNGDIWKVIQAVEQNFDKRVGLTELMYGYSSRQMRSAAEADVKQEAVKIRPDDMANKTEDWMADAARKEALAARWHLEPQDVAPVLGPMGAQFWGQYIVSSNPSEIVHSLEYRIEADSIRKPNKEKDSADANQAMQNMLPFFSTLAMQTGQVGPFNTLVSFWGKANEVDVSGMMIQPPPPPPPPGAGQPQPSGPPGPPQAGGKAA